MENQSPYAEHGDFWDMTFDTYNDAAQKREGFAPLIALDEKRATFGLLPRRDAVVMLYYLIMIQDLPMPEFCYRTKIGDRMGLVPFGLTCSWEH